MAYAGDVAREIVENSFPDRTVSGVEPLDGGETHETVAVSFPNRDTVVVKYTRDGTDRLQRDCAVLQYVDRYTTVPVPNVFDWGRDPAYFVMEALPGESSPQLREFEVKGASEYLRTAGELLGTLHRDAPFDSVGHVEGAADGTLRHDPAESWPAFYRKLKRETASELTGTRFGTVAFDAVAVLPDVTDGMTVERPVLAHCDFGPNNVFRDDGGVTGVIDWEWGLAADPVYDLVRAERLFRTGRHDETRQSLLEGYRSVRPVPEGYERREAIYSAYETLSAMSSFEVWAPDGEKEAQKSAEQLRESFYERLPE